jgi:acetylornithine deacetylase/succinyl-diaminopimelate desuccinylase-like protein
LLRGLTVGALAPALLKLLPDPSVARAIRAVLGNTATPTVLAAGNKTNVIPAEASCEIDGRVVAGQTADSLIEELRAIVGRDLHLEVLRQAPAISTEPASPVWDALVATLRDHDPAGIPVPYMIPGFTDAQAWSGLGTKVYGFAPVRFPPDGPRFADLFHGDDERIPIAGLRWGIAVLHDAVLRIARDAG